ncbi:MAG: hypothetical protein AB7O68_06030 [Pirellulales bacterium]
MKFKFLAIAIVAGLACGLAPWGSTGAFANPVGTSYTVAGTNFPNDYAATKVTIDGVAELVGGDTGMLVNEVITDFAGLPGGLVTTNSLPANPNNGNVADTPNTLSAFENPGILAEWIFRSNSGGPYNSKLGPWSVDVQGVDMGSGAPVTRPEQTQFLYFLDGDGNAMSPSANGIAFLTANGVGVGPHPTNVAVPLVIFLGADEPASEVDSFPDGIIDFTIEDTGNLNANLIGFLLEFPESPSGFAVGALHAVPEPSSVALAMLGGISLLFVGRSRVRRSK